MFSKLFEKLYHKIFVNIVVAHHTSTVYVETINSKGKVINSTEEEFQTKTLNKEMKTFIQKSTVESPYYYVSLLDKSKSQGALPTANPTQYSKYKDLYAYNILSVDDNWSIYSEKGEIYSIEKEYEALPLDMLFSPFLILHNFFQDKIQLPMTMFILIEKGFLSLSIYNESKLLYAEHLDLEHSKDNDELLLYEDDGEFEDEGIELDDLDAIEELDEIDLFDDFGDIEDLDSIDDIDDFSESKDITEDEELLEEKLEEDTIQESDSETGFNEDYQRFLLIQSSLSKFYKDDLYESEFIENVFLADGVGVSHDLKRFLEEEMFLSVYMRKIDLPLALCELAKKEIGL